MKSRERGNAANKNDTTADRSSEAATATTSPTPPPPPAPEDSNAISAVGSNEDSSDNRRDVATRSLTLNLLLYVIIDVFVD